MRNEKTKENRNTARKRRYDTEGESVFVKTKDAARPLMKMINRQETCLVV